MQRTLTEFCKKAFIAKAKFPWNYVADELFKMKTLRPCNEELYELRKNVARMQKLLNFVRDRNAVPECDLFDDDSWQTYAKHHNLSYSITECISMAFVTQPPDPYLYIAEYIKRQPENILFCKKETEELQKRLKICKDLIQHFMNKQQLTLKEVEEFSTKTVNDEMIADRLQ